MARVAPESPKAYRIATNNCLGNTERQGVIMFPINDSYPKIILTDDDLQLFTNEIDSLDDLEEDFDFIFNSFYFVYDGKKNNKGTIGVRKSENWISVDNGGIEDARYLYSKKEFRTNFDNDDDAVYTLRLYATLMKYIMKKVNERNVREIKTESKTKRKLNDDISEKTNKTENNIYLFKDIIKYVNKENTGLKNKFTCECWQVKGHYRHYKSGKVVFVHSYKKGKKRETSQTKGKKYFLSE